jgi:hypothetical protein
MAADQNEKSFKVRYSPPGRHHWSLRQEVLVVTHRDTTFRWQTGGPGHPRRARFTDVLSGRYVRVQGYSLSKDRIRATTVFLGVEQRKLQAI